MAAPDVEFTRKECRAMMNFLFLKGKATIEMYDDISVTFGENKNSSYLTLKNWVAGFKTQHFSTEYEGRPGRLFVVTLSENVDAIHSMILDDRIKKLIDTLEI
jgi:hypothetical protein